MQGHPVDLLDLAATPLLALALAALAVVDLRERRLPDRLTLPLLACGLALAAWRAGGWPLAEMAGAAGGFLAFWAMGEAHLRRRGVEGLGLGDAKLLAAAGAWLGWRPLPGVVLVAALGALAFALARRPEGRALAFGPWLGLGIMIAWGLRLAAGGG